MERITIWALGIFFTGFVFLVSWLIKVQLEVRDRVTYKWIEEHFQIKVEKNINELSKTLKIIHDAIVGTVEKKGIVTKLHEHDNRIEKLEVPEK